MICLDDINLEAEDTYDRAVYNRLAILLKMMAVARFGRMRYLRLKSARLCLVLSLCKMVLAAKYHGLDSRVSISLGRWNVPGLRHAREPYRMLHHTLPHK
jgi:hypothetical protein